MFTTIFTQIKLYKNAIIAFILLSLFIAYSVFLWRTASAISSNNFARERAQLQQKVTDEVARRNEISSSVGALIDKKLSENSINTTTIVKEVRREIDKNTFYTTCTNTPSVVQHLNNARDSANKAIGK